MRRAVREADEVAVSEVGYVEARSAFARRKREGFFSTEGHDHAAELLKSDFREVYLTRPATREVLTRAGELVGEHALRTYDAVHLATALALREEISEEFASRQQQGSTESAIGGEPRVLLMAYDSSLIRAARKESLAYKLRETDESSRP